MSFSTKNRIEFAVGRMQLRLQDLLNHPQKYTTAELDQVTLHFTNGQLRTLFVDNLLHRRQSFNVSIIISPDHHRCEFPRINLRSLKMSIIIK